MAKVSKDILARSCTSCHGPGAAHVDDPSPENINRNPEPKACALCHADRAGGMELNMPAHPLNGVKCLDCHVSGHSDPGTTHMPAKPVNRLCASCHQLEAAKFQRPYAHRKGGQEPFECTACHDPHGESRRGRLTRLHNGGVGKWRERYAVRIPVTDSPTGYSDDVYFPPIQYDNAPNRWIPYKATAWWMSDGTPKVHSGMTRAEVASAVKTTFSKNCIGCHTTGIRHMGKTSEGEWQYTPYVATLYRADDPHYFDYDGDGNKDLINIGCEMCHGPGSDHVLGGGDPSKIVNPAKLDPEQANEICGRCHNRQRSVPNKTFSWPYHDDTDTQWTPATEPLSDFKVDAGEFWPDGVTGYEHNQHYVELLSSAHWNNPYQKLRCFDCHEAHGGSNTAQIVPEIESDGVTIPTENENNTLCLACHATHDTPSRTSPKKWWLTTRTTSARSAPP